MHDANSSTGRDKLSELIIYVVCQLERLSVGGSLSLSEECVAGLVGDLEESFRRSLELEKQFFALQRSHARLAKITGVYDFSPRPKERRAAFAVVGGTDHEPDTSKEGETDD